MRTSCQSGLSYSHLTSSELYTVIGSYRCAANAWWKNKKLLSCNNNQLYMQKVHICHWLDILVRKALGCLRLSWLHLNSLSTNKVCMDGGPGDLQFGKSLKRAFLPWTAASLGLDSESNFFPPWMCYCNSLLWADFSFLCFGNIFLFFLEVSCFKSKISVEFVKMFHLIVIY